MNMFLHEAYCDLVSNAECNTETFAQNQDCGFCSHLIVQCTRVMRTEGIITVTNNSFNLQMAFKYCVKINFKGINKLNKNIDLMYIVMHIDIKS